MKIAGKIAIVTGAGSGLGAATARHLAALGARVAVLDLNPVTAKIVAAEINGHGIACDVADAKSAELAIAEVIASLGQPSILVNCAGIGAAKRIVGKEGPQNLADFERVIRVNLLGTFNMMRLAAHAMQACAPNEDGERGVIVSTASVAAYEGQIGQAAYAASKGGIVSLTLPAAREFSSFGVRVLTIAPGLFHTPLMETLPPEVQQSLGASIPFPKRLGQPQEFAQLVVSCVENPFLNGETIRLDGALRLAPR